MTYQESNKHPKLPKNANFRSRIYKSKRSPQFIGSNVKHPSKSEPISYQKSKSNPNKYRNSVKKALFSFEKYFLRFQQTIPISPYKKGSN